MFHNYGFFSEGYEPYSMATTLLSDRRKLEEQLQSAPLNVLLLGQLVEIAARHDDFKLDKDANYTLMSHDRLRPTFVQVAQACSAAFEWGEKYMDRISQIMGTIPRNIKKCLRILKNDYTAEETARYMILPIATLKHAVGESVKHAGNLYGNFTKVRDLLAEVVEVLDRTQGIIKFRITRGS